MKQLAFEFAGTTSASCSLDPGEYAGMTVPQIANAVLEVLKGINPNANFFPEDALAAAEEIQKARDAPV